jgi:hypothetical protein
MQQSIEHYHHLIRTRIIAYYDGMTMDESHVTCLDDFYRMGNNDTGPSERGAMLPT